MLIDLCDLTGSLKKHKIDIANCRGQTYDTTSSMSSSKKDVQAEIACIEPCNLSCLRNKTDTKHDGQLPWIVEFFRQLYKKATPFGYRYWSPEKRWGQKTETENLVQNKMDWALLNVWNNLRSIRIRSCYPRWNIHSLWGWALNVQTRRHGIGMPVLEHWQMAWDT